MALCSIIMQGPLKDMLKVKRKRIWVNRFVVVQDGLLYYFLKPTDLKPRGIMNLVHCKVGEVSEGSKYTITISHGTESALRLRFDDKRKFATWLAAVKGPNVTRESSDMISVRNCECAIGFSVSRERNANQVAHMNLLKPDASLLDTVARLTQKTYILRIHNGALVYCAQGNADISDTPLWPVYGGLAALAGVGYLVSPLLATAAVVGMVYWRDTRNRQTVEATSFKAVISVNAGISEVLSTLLEASSRPLWHPKLANFQETKSSLTLYFNGDTGRLAQRLKQEAYGDFTTAYLVESVDGQPKNFFMLEDRSSALELCTLVTHFGQHDTQKEDPLVGSWDILNSLKVFVESRHKDSAPETDSDNEAEEVKQPVEKVDPNVKRYSDEVEPVYFEVKRLLAEISGWEEVSISSQHVKATRKKAQTGLFFVRGEGLIRRSPDEIIELLKDLNRKPQFDELFESGEVIDQINADIDITYQRFKKKFGVSGRDFCIVTKKFIELDGTILFISCSTTHPSCPPVKGLVRGTLHMGVFVMKQTEEGTLTTYITHADPGGSLPNSIVSSVQKKQPLVIEAIRNLLG